LNISLLLAVVAVVAQAEREAVEAVLAAWQRALLR
jgi:hypothetical protein